MKLKVATVLTILSMVIGVLYTQDVLYERKAHAGETEQRIWMELERTNLNQETLAMDMALERVEGELLDILKVHGNEPGGFPLEIFERYTKLKNREERLSRRYDELIKKKLDNRYGD